MQKTYKGFTGHTLLFWAQITEFESDNFEITNRSLPGCVLMPTQEDTLIIRDATGIVAELKLGRRGIELGENVIARLEDMYQRKNKIKQSNKIEKINTYRRCATKRINKATERILELAPISNAAEWAMLKRRIIRNREYKDTLNDLWFDTVGVI